MVSHSSIQASKGPGTPDSGKRNSLLRKGVFLLLALLLALSLARLGFVILAAAPTTGPGGPADANNTPATAVDIARLQSGSLFGTRVAGTSAAAQTAAQRPSAAAASALGLRLEGVVVGNPPTQGFAMISGGGSSGSFRIGDRLPAGNRVVLDSIHPDRVVIENNGRMETLWLYGSSDNAAASRPSAAVSSTSTRVTGEGSYDQGSYDPMALVREYREKFADSALSADFLTLSEIAQVSPEYVNGQMVGYRLSPGEHLKEFVRLGFKTNDIVTSINGIELNDVANMPELFGQMTTAKDVSLTLLRDGAPLALELSLADLPK